MNGVRSDMIRLSTVVNSILQEILVSSLQQQPSHSRLILFLGFPNVKRKPCKRSGSVSWALTC